MNPGSFRPVLLVLAFACAGWAQTNSAKPVDKVAIVSKARQSYYSLKELGVTGFTCRIEPDWDTMYKSVPIDEVGEKQVLPLLKQTSFGVVVGKDGGATVSKKMDTAPASQQAAERYRVSSDGVEQIVTGFFQTWSNFVFNLPLPGATEPFEFEEVGDAYRITSKEGDNVAVLILGRDDVLKSLRAKTPKFDITVDLKMQRTAKDRLLLSGYDANVPVNDKTEQQMSVAIQYQELGEVMLPLEVRAKINIPKGTIQANFAFRDCKYQK